MTENSHKQTHLDELMDMQELLEEYAKFGQNPANNENCAILLEMAKDLVEKLEKEAK